MVHSGHPKIPKLKVIFTVDENILRLDVPMQDFASVKLIEGLTDLGYEFPNFHFVESVFILFFLVDASL